MFIKELSIKDIDTVKELFVAVFTIAPWYDDWSDEVQLNAYLTDIMGNPNSLIYGLFEEEELIGFSIGRTKHWYQGTEYLIEEICVESSRQEQGVGTAFLELLEKSLVEKGVKSILLLTDRNVPAYKFYKKRNFRELKNDAVFYKKL